MTYPNSPDKRPGCWRWLLLVVALAVFALAFRNEWLLAYRLLAGLGKSVQGQSLSETLPAADEVLRAFGFIGLNLVLGSGFAILLFFLASGFVLPTRNHQERRQVLTRLIRSASGHRPSLARVVEGEIVGEDLEERRDRWDAMIVDLNSAVVLERRWLPHLPSKSESTRAGKSGQPGRPLQNPFARVGGPGLVFFRPGERLRGVVSLRVQHASNPGVRAYTSDGIEVETKVSTTFTLGQPPNVVKVAYCGETADDLRVLWIDPETRKINQISDELDDIDREEVHRYAQQFLVSGEPTALLAPSEEKVEFPPFTIQEQRILAAIYSQGRDVLDSKTDHWTSLPPLVATEVFRYMLSQVTYDWLYLPDDPVNFPLNTEFIPSFVRAMRYMGVISFQFLHRLDGGIPEVGQKVDYRQFRLSPVQEFRSSKVLRDRGIKVISASFSDLKPIDPAIRQQRLENWRARWQKEIEISRADQELEVTRILNHARAEKQREMITNLSQILQSSSFSEEALTLRIFQALEDVATDPNAKRMLPHDTLSMLRNLRLWLLPEENVVSSLTVEKLASQSDKPDD